MPNANVHVTATIKKATADDDGTVRMYGWAAMSRDDLGEPVVDSDDEYIPIVELERAAQDAFVRRGGAGAVGVQHSEYGKADLVESFVLSGEKRQAFGLGDGPQGWIVGLRSRDPDVAKAVRSGALLELSLRGRGRVERVRVPTGSTAGDILKRETETNSTELTVGVIRELELADAELLSIVDRGASANNRVRSRIVLVKRQKSDHKGGAMPSKDEVAKARSPQVILADLFEAGKLAELPAEEKEALLMALSGMAAAPAAPEPPPEGEDDGMPKAEDEDMPKTEDEDMPKVEGEDEDMSKREKDLIKAIAELKTDNADLRKRIERSDVVDMVKRDMPHFPGASVDELADLVQEARLNFGKSDAEKLERLLKAASEACKGSDKFKTNGVRKSDGVAGDAKAELLALAKAKRDANPQLSRHEAMRLAGKERPELWASRND